MSIPYYEKEFVVYEVNNNVDDVKSAVVNGVPLSSEVSSLLDEFNKFDVKRLLERKGREKVLEEITLIETILKEDKATHAVNEGIEIAQSIYPSKAIKPIPIYLVYAGGSTDAKAIHGGFVINFGNLIHHEPNIHKLLELVKSISAHETVHQFLDQLGVLPEKEESVDDEILNAIWEEGLTTYVQTVQYPWHLAIAEDYVFYAHVVKDWVTSKGDNEKRKAVLERCIGRESFKKFLEYQGEWYKENVLEGEDIDHRFFMLMQKCNGPAYHLGYMLWKKQLEKGIPIDNLVIRGHKQITNWLGEV